MLHRCRVSSSPGWWSWTARWRSTRPPTSSWSPRRCSPTWFPTCCLMKCLCLQMDCNLISTFFTIPVQSIKSSEIENVLFNRRKKKLSKKFLSLSFDYFLLSESVVFVDSVFFSDDFCHFKIVPFFFWRKTIFVAILLWWQQHLSFLSIHTKKC